MNTNEPEEEPRLTKGSREQRAWQWNDPKNWLDHIVDDYNMTQMPLMNLHN
jgi:hypothetical protein